MRIMTDRALVRQTSMCGIALAMTMLAHPVSAQGKPLAASSDSVAAVSTVERFQQALASADSAAALALLADSALILESGELETRSAYRSDHLAADVEFTRAVGSERHVERVTIAGDVAWIVATTRTKGKFRGRDVNSVGAELMVLTRTTAGWRIAAIHWSSHRVPGG
jgi:ketosteroid isomerase-like protein